MANIIENTKKVKRILHKFDTAENWKKSTIKLLPGELAFDENGNFKVGLNDRPNGTLWSDLPFAGKSKFISGSTEEKPTVSKNDSYSPGDMFKDTTTNKWYFLTGFDSYGEYIWEELTFGSHDIESSIDKLEEKLTQKIDASVFEEELSKKADTSYVDDAVSSLATKNELLSIAELTDEHSEKIESLEENVLNAMLQLEDKAGGEELEALANSLMSYTNEEINVVNAKLGEKATKDELQRAISTLEEKHELDLSSLELATDEKISFKADKEELTSLEEKLNSSIAQKVDVSTIFDESGNIRSALLPGSVDDIVEGVFIEDTVFMPLEGTSQVGVGGKLYLDVNTKILYRWSGSQYVAISAGNSSLILGTTAGTAYEGSSGKALEDRVSNLEGKASEQSERLASVEANVTKQGDSLSSVSKTVEGLSTTVGEHTKSIASLNAKVDACDSKIATAQSDIKEHTTKLANVDKQISLIEAKNADQDATLKSLSSEVAKVNAFDVRLNTLDTTTKELKSDISTLEITTDALTDQLGKLSNLESKVDGVSVEISSLKSVVSEHANKFVEQNGKIAVIENNVSTQAGLLDTLNTSVSGLSSSISEQNKKIDSLEDEVVAQKATVSALNDSVAAQKTQLDSTTQLAQGFSDRILTLENSDAQQNSRLSGIEKTVVTQIQEISSIKTSVDSQKDKLSSLEGKVDNLLKLDTPDGTLTLGKLAFQDKVQNQDIEGVSITKLMQEEDAELELWCGDSNF